MKIFEKIKRRLLHFRLRSIQVFCFHQVSDVFDESTMKPMDWLQTDVFKQLILDLKNQGYEFISLPQAQKHLRYDLFRRKKYAVLTADDGWASLRNILPWMNEQQIPVTLFLNPAYLDGKHFRVKTTEQYLASDEVAHLYEQYPLLTIGSHGWEHTDATIQTEEAFRDSIAQSIEYLEKLPNYIPYFAYTWGRRSVLTDVILEKRGLVQVLMDDEKNYKNYNIIHRELLK